MPRLRPWHFICYNKGCVIHNNFFDRCEVETKTFQRTKYNKGIKAKATHTNFEILVIKIIGGKRYAVRTVTKGYDSSNEGKG